MAAPPPPLPPSGVEGPVPDTPLHLSIPSTNSNASGDSDSKSQPRRRRSRQVTEFEDVDCMVLPYCRTFMFKITPDFDYRDDCDTEDEEDTNHVANPRETLIKYVNQIRRSFGFDVDCIAPSWFNGVFVPFDLTEENQRQFPKYYAGVFEAADFAIAEINSDLDGERYEFVKIEKIVRGKPWRKLLTHRVKEVNADETKIIQAIVYSVGYTKLELLQWRFKPVEDDAWYQPPPLEYEYPWLKPNQDILDVVNKDA